MTGDEIGRGVSLPIPLLLLAIEACDEYEAGWRSGGRPQIESFLTGVDSPLYDDLLARLVEMEVELRVNSGENPDLDEYRSRFPDDPHLVETAYWCGIRNGKAPVVEGQTKAPSFGIFVPSRFGDYELQRCVGKGGMGSVYQALEISTGRPVAIKLIRSDLLESIAKDSRREVVKRFLAEAQAVAALTHEHIVPLYRFGEIDGRHFYVMRFIDGPSLAEINKREALNPLRAAALLATIARAVDYAHTRGILHRDLKPSNILVDAADRPYVTDFGLAKKLFDTSPELTPSMAIIGTPTYLAPEVIAGSGSGRFSAASDIYSLGATLYELIAGQPPFEAAEPLALFRKITDDEPIAPSRLRPHIARDLETICLKCLSKVARLRYPSAGALAGDLERFLAGIPIQGRRLSLIERLKRWLQRRGRALSAALVALGALIAVFIVRVESWNDKINDKADAIISADIGGMSRLSGALGDDRKRVVQRVIELANEAPLDQGRRLRAALIAVQDDPRQIDVLCDHLLTCDLEEMPVLVACLCDVPHVHMKPSVDRLWSTFRSNTASSASRLRAACALAKLSAADDRWPFEGAAIGDVLVVEQNIVNNPEVVAGWLSQLDTLSSYFEPRLHELFFDRSQRFRGIAASCVLSQLLFDQPEKRSSLVAAAEPDQLRPLVERWPTDSKAFLSSLVKLLPPPRRHAAHLPPDQLEREGKQRANIAAVLLQGENRHLAFEALELREDPSSRALLPELLGALKTDCTMLLELARYAPPLSRQSVILALSHSSGSESNSTCGDALASKLIDLYVNDPHPGVHSVSRLALKRRDRIPDLDRADADLPIGFRSNEMGWYQEVNGHCLAVVAAPSKFEMVWRPDEMTPATSLQREIKHSFAVSTTMVTVEQYSKFMLDQKIHHQDHRDLFRSEWYDKVVSPSVDCPVNSINFHAAASYCNWLSRISGIAEEEMCYEQLGLGPIGKVRLRSDYRQRTGYRLLDEEEWICAYRAGTQTRYSFGQSRDLLNEYVWLKDVGGRVTHAVGGKRPNDFGIHDMMGSLYEWCSPPPDYAPRRKMTLVSQPFDADASLLDASRSILADPSFLDQHVGFRIGRTLPIH